MEKFKATHKITVTSATRTDVEEVMLVDGVGYTRDEWENQVQADWTVYKGEWRFQGRVSPLANSTVSVEAL